MISPFPEWHDRAIPRISELFLGLSGVELGIVLDGLYKSVVALNWGITLKHVENEAFLDGLLHCIGVERSE